MPSSPATWRPAARSTIADVDQGQSNFTAQAGTAGSNGYGTFTLDADGNWTYTANDSQAAIQQLGAGQSITDSFTAVSSDGTASQLVTVTINGTNDVPVIGGVATGAVTEDVAVVAGNLTTSGALTIADVDQGQSNFTAQASTAGDGYGTFTLDADGNWTYTANDSQAAIQQLGAGQSITDSFTAVSSDGTASQLVTVTINGTNDVPVIGGVATGAVTEDVARRRRQPDDQRRADHRRRRSGPVQLRGPGRHRRQQRLRHLHARCGDGNWTYTANDSQAAIQQLGAGQSITDSFTAVSSDGTASQLVTVTIHGTNDVPVIGGVATGAVTEDVAVVAGNLATERRADHRRRRSGPVQLHRPGQHAGSNGYGTFTLDAERQLDLHRQRQPGRDPAARRRPVASPTASPPSPPTAPPASSSPSPSTAPTTCR